MPTHQMGWLTLLHERSIAAGFAISVTQTEDITGMAIAFGLGVDNFAQV